MRHWLKDPLLHFFIIGGLLFAAHTWLNPIPTLDPRVVRVTAEEVHWLKQTWTRQWQRPPNELELRGLATDYVKEKLLAIEARELGLEENDTIVRRRLAQKMEFLMQDTASFAEPGEDELHHFYSTLHEHFQTPAQISFHQIYFKSEVGARQGLKELSTTGMAELGDPILLEREYTQADEQTVTSLFGPEFSRHLSSLTPGSWQGPIKSGYGFHLVRVTEQLAGQPRPFDEVRDQVLNKWHRSQQDNAKKEFFAELLKKYNVIVDGNIKLLMEQSIGKVRVAER